MRSTELCPATSAVHDRLAVSNTEHVILAPGGTPLGMALTGTRVGSWEHLQLCRGRCLCPAVTAFLNMNLLPLTHAGAMAVRLCEDQTAP